MSIAGYLKRSTSRGNYSYRRRIPKDLQVVWGRTEEKTSLKTKSHPEALRRAAVVNTEFDRKAAQLSHQISGEKLPNRNVMEVAKEILVKEGIHPQQIPTTKEKADRFFRKQDEWKDLWMDILPGVTEHNSYDAAGNIQTEYEADESNPWYQAHNVISGEEGLSMVPTLQEATEAYLQINAADKQRTSANQKKHEQRIWRAIGALGSPATPVTEFNRLRARRHKEALQANNPTWATDTLNKTIGMLTAVFSTVIREYELTIQNPWSGLKDKMRTEDASEKRRSFSPVELNLYVECLNRLNPEARLIGLLMVYTGCRTMECAGLTYGDLKLQNNTPHIQLRPNHLRTLKNPQSIRDVPLIDKALDDLRAHLTQNTSTDPKSPVFPRYGRDGGMDAVSQLLNGVIRNRMKIDDPTLVAYSSRHTMKDKMRSIRAAIGIQQDILGHGKRSAEDNYGSGEPLRYLLEELIKADAVEHWGN